MVISVDNLVDMIAIGQSEGPLGIAASVTFLPVYTFITSLSLLWRRTCHSNRDVHHERDSAITFSFTEMRTAPYLLSQLPSIYKGHHFNRLFF